MSASAIIGNMVANLDKKTGAIRLTSKEKGSRLKKDGFMVNITPGSKEHTMLSELIEKEAVANSPWIEKVLAAQDTESRIELLMDMWVWDNIEKRKPHHEKEVRSVAKKALADLDRYYDKSNLWVEGLSIDNMLRTYSSPSVFRSEEHWGNKMSDRKKSSSIYYSDAYFTLLAGAEDILRFVMIEAQRTLPRSIPLSEEHRSLDPMVVPLGADYQNNTFSWDANKSPSILSIKDSDDRKDKVASLVLRHVARNRMTTQAFFIADAYSDELSRIPMARENIRETTSLEETCKIVEDRLECLKRYSHTEFQALRDSGEIKTTFVVLSSSQLTGLMKKLGSENVKQIIEDGPQVGVYIVLSTNQEDEKELHWDFVKDIATKISFVSRNLTGSDDVFVNLHGNQAIIEKDSSSSSILGRFISVFTDEK